IAQMWQQLMIAIWACVLLVALAQLTPYTPYKSQKPALAVNSFQDSNNHGDCQPMAEGICKNIFYENTRMPNMFKHATQAEANKEKIEVDSVLQHTPEEEEVSPWTFLTLRYRDKVVAAMNQMQDQNTAHPQEIMLSPQGIKGHSK
ncbi:hypothetical protein Ciccas_006788, partial [Cichlidogyrus casuarinus]